METLRLILIFIKIGAISFGGGWTVVGLIKVELVGSGIMQPSEFSQAVAIAQLSPGPVALNVATMSGYKVAGPLGAIACTLAVIAIPLLALFLAMVLAQRIPIKKELGKESFRVGSLAMMAFTVWNTGYSGDFSWRGLIIGLLSFGVSAFTEFHPALLILLCALANMLIGLFMPA